MDPQAAFQVLQPASIGVARDQSVESVRGLCRAVEQVLATEKGLRNEDVSSCINEMKEFLLFPVFIILKSGKKLSWTMLEEIVRCALTVLRQSSVEDFTFFQEVFSQLFILLTNKDDPQLENKLSEECKQMTLMTLTVLIRNSSPAVLRKMNGNAFRPQLGHAVFICLKLAQREKNRSLKIEAVECLLALGQHKSFSRMSEKEQTILSNTFANFLPGIVTGLAKIVTADEKQGHKITSAAIDAWVYFVVLVMRDAFLEGKVSRLEESETVAQLRAKLFEGDDVKKISKVVPKKQDNKFFMPEPDEEDALPSKLQSVEVNRKWVCETAEKLVILIQSMIKLVSHPHWKVRLSLLQFAERLICKCSKSLTGAVILALQVIVTLRGDDIVDVGSAAQNALLAVMNVIGFGGQNSQVQKGLFELLEEHVYALCTQLPTIFRQQEDAKTLSSVRQLVGCLEVLGDRILQLMTWPSHSMRLLRSIRFGLTIDVADSDLLLERTSAEDPFSILTIKPSLGRNFKYFQDVRIFECIASSCRLIGFHSDVTVISDLCLELLQETQSRKETFMVFTLVIQGRDRSKWKDKDASWVSSDENEKVVQNILDVMISQEVFNVPLCVATSGTSGTNKEDNNEHLTNVLVPVNRQQNISVDVVKSNVILVAHALNLVSATAQMLGKDFEMFLSVILCPVMEKTGDSNVLVGYTGRNTLLGIAQACGYETVAKLIENSVPHYWYALSLKLKRLLQYPSAPLVLQVCLEYASIDVIAFTEELVQDVLLCLDTYHSEQAVPLLRVLLVYVMAVIRYGKKPSDAEQSSAEGENADTKENGLRKSDSSVRNESEYTKLGELASFLEDYNEKQLCIKQSLEKEVGQSTASVEEIRKGFHNDGEKSEDDAMEEIDRAEESKPEAPAYIKHVVEILEKCSHLLYSQERKLKLLILEIIKAGSEALAKWEDQRLPVFHKLWKPLVLRLKDTDFVVMMRSFEVLTVISVSSGDFLRRRVLKEIFPVAYSFLKNQSSVSLKKTKKSGYYMTMAYRAQCALLKHLPDLVNALSLGVLESGELLHVLMLYLDTRQPQQLLNSSMVVVRQISVTHPQQVWLSLAYQQPAVRIEPPSSCLDPLQIRSTPAGYLPNEAAELYRHLS